MALECNVVDVGARYGVHPTWLELINEAQLFLFEMDTAEAERLAEKYRDYPNIEVRNLAVMSCQGEVSYQVRRHKGLNSLFKINENCIANKGYMVDDFASDGEAVIQAEAIDTLFSRQQIHFLKVDTEGAELEVLRGAQHQLLTTVLGVRAEANFLDIHAGAPLFGEVHQFLRECGFELLNFDYDGRGHGFGPFTLPGKYGQLVATDAVWIKNLESVHNDTTCRAENTIRLALFLMANKATDVATDLLLKACRQEKECLVAFYSDPLFLKLKRQIAFLFKSLLPEPWCDKAEMRRAYRIIFGEDFPEGHGFFESFLIS